LNIEICMPYLFIFTFISSKHFIFYMIIEKIHHASNASTAPHCHCTYPNPSFTKAAVGGCLHLSKPCASHASSTPNTTPHSHTTTQNKNKKNSFAPPPHPLPQHCRRESEPPNIVASPLPITPNVLSTAAALFI